MTVEEQVDRLGEELLALTHRIAQLSQCSPVDVATMLLDQVTS